MEVLLNNADRFVRHSEEFIVHNETRRGEERGCVKRFPSPVATPTMPSDSSHLRVLQQPSGLQREHEHVDHDDVVSYRRGGKGASHKAGLVQAFARLQRDIHLIPKMVQFIGGISLQEEGTTILLSLPSQAHSLLYNKIVRNTIRYTLV